MSYGRTRKQAKLDEKRTFDDMVKQGPSETARRAFKRDARKEYGVKQCLIKWGVDMKGVIAGGNDKRTVSIVQEQPTRDRRAGLDAE